MQNEFIEILISTVSQRSTAELSESFRETVDEEEMNSVYNKIIDGLVHNIFFETIGDELLLKAFEKLPRLEKIIVVFNIMLNYSPSEVAVIANTTPTSIHAQKYKALQRLRKAIGIK